MLRRALCAVLAVLSVSVAQAAPDPATVKALSTAYAARALASFYRDACLAQVPSSAAAVRQAFTAWAQAQGVADLDAQLPKVLAADVLAQLKASAEAARPGFLAALQKLGSPERACAAYPSQLASGPFNLKTTVPNLATLLRSAGGGQGGSAQGAAAPGGTAVYSVAQLSTLAGTVLAGLPRQTPGAQQEAAVMKKLASLGTPLVVTGTVPADRGWLSQEDQRHTARWNVRCYSFADEDASLSAFHGKSVTVVGTLRDFDRSTFIELDDCRILTSGAGLKKSSLPITEAGWRYKAQPAETFLVAAGKGLRDDQLLGVYTQQISTVGVGGMVVLAFQPYLFLKDGTVYSDPSWAPGSFNVTRSRDLEPQKWGRWTRTGKNFVISWGDGQSETFTPQFQSTPAAPGMKLSGSYRHLGGGGNSALGGDVTVAVSSTYTFSPDGRFTGGGSAGATTSTVTAASSKSVSGRYTLSGYGLTLRYDDGGEKRLFYYTVDSNMIHIGGADFLK